MSELLHLRASRVPLAMLCPESTVDDGGPKLGGSSAPADLGSADHGLIARWIERGTPDAGEIDEFAERWAVDDRDEFRQLAWATWNLWLKVRQWFPEPQTEVYMESAVGGIKLTGTTDLISYLPDKARVHLLDHKTGRLDVDAEHQLRAYAVLALERHPETTAVYAAVLRVRDGSLDPHQWSREDLEHWFAGLVERMTRRGQNEFNPGGHCRFCPRRLTCPAKEAYIRQARNALLDLHNQISPTTGTLNLPDDPLERGQALNTLLDRVKTLEKICEDARSLIKADVAAHGSLPINDAYELAIRKDEQRPISFVPGFQTLMAVLHSLRLSEQEIAAAQAAMFRVSKTAAGELIRDLHPDGAKKAAWSAVLEKLEEAGALGHKSNEKLVTRKALPKIEQQPAQVGAGKVADYLEAHYYERTK